MRRSIPSSNPFREVPRFAFGYEFIVPGMRLLDYGCFEGWFGAELLKHKAVNYVGVDKDADVLKKKLAVPVVVIKDRVPFEDETFDIATAFEVLEHVQDQDGVVRELWRVLKKGGLLVVSVPRRHIFTFLDMGNWKFIFPRAHKMFYRLRHSEEAYRYRYVDNPYGLIGNVEKGKSWHQHFRDDEMHALLRRSGFAVVETDGAGLFSSVFDVFGYVPVLNRLFSQQVRNLDDYAFNQRGLLCVARKPS